MGLLGDSFDDPKTQATFQLAAGLLGGGNFGQALGRGLGGYQQTLQADEDRKMNRLMREAQLQALKDQDEQRKLAIQQAQMKQDFMRQFAQTPDAMQVGPVQPGAAQPYRSASIGDILNSPEKLALAKLNGIDLTDVAALAKPKWENINGNLVNTNDPGFKGGFQPGLQVTPNGQAVFWEVNENGRPVVGAAPGSLPTVAAFQRQEQQIKNQNSLLPLEYVDSASGRPLGGNVDAYLNPQQSQGLSQADREAILADARKNGIANPVVSPNWNYGSKAAPQLQSKAEAEAALIAATAPAKATAAGAEGIAKATVDQLKTSFEQAKAAKASLNTIQNIESILNDKKLMLGTGSDARVALARLGQTIGVGGKDDAEKLANTTALVQQLSQAQMDAAKQMAGQGNITENERRLIADTAAGNSSFTAGELKMLSSALRKTSEYTIQGHSALVGKMRQNPLYANQLDAFTIDAPRSSPAPASGGVKFLGFE